MFSGSLPFIVIGSDFKTRPAPGRLAEIEMSVPGDRFTLRREHFDIQGYPAVGVYSTRGRQIGYIYPTEAHLLRELAPKAQVIFQGSQEWGATVIVTVDGSVPALPQPKAKRRLIMPPRPPRDEYAEIFAQRTPKADQFHSDNLRRAAGGRR